MTVKHRHAFDDGVGEVQNDIHGTGIRNIPRIQPLRMREGHTILRIGQKMHLVYVERMQLGGSIEDSPMLISTYAGAGYWTCVRRVLAAVDVEAILVLGEDDGEARRSLLQRLYVDRLIQRRTLIDSMRFQACRLCIGFMRTRLR